jgi:hypothetical protein
MLSIISSGNRGCCSSTVPVREPPLLWKIVALGGLAPCTCHTSPWNNRVALSAADPRMFPAAGTGRFDFTSSEEDVLVKHLSSVSWFPFFFICMRLCKRTRDAAVGARRARGRSSSPGRFKNFIHVVQIGSGVHPTSCQMHRGALSPRVYRQGREADHSPTTSAEVKKMWMYASIPQYVYMA